jgi:predicted nucleic acid-binding protein
MEKVFVDSDIILDLLAKREPFYQYAAEFFLLVEKERIKAYVSPIIITNLHYILRKIKNKKQAIKSLQKLKLLVKILPVDEKIVELALASDLNDFEDAIQYYTAKENGIDYLLTRNKKDFKRADITVMTAEEYLEIFKSTNNSTKDTSNDHIQLDIPKETTPKEPTK